MGSIAKKYEIVSLGQNCLSRTILTRWNIKPSKAEGELSCPFDLVKHELSRINYYIENDFEGYFDDLFFILRKRNFLDFRGKGLWRKNDGTIFFHDKDCRINDRDKLIRRISARIDNFREIIKSDTPILFVLNICDFHKNCNADMEIKNLYNTLKKVRENKYFKLAVFDFGGVTTDCDDYAILRIPAPIENFEKNWYKSSFVNSSLGNFFEKIICEFIKDILKKDFNV